MVNKQQIEEWYRQQLLDTSVQAMANYNMMGNVQQPMYQSSVRNNTRSKKPYWNGTSFNTKRYQRDEFTLTLAMLPPMDEPDSQMRQLAYKDVVTKVESASRPSWEWKCAALTDQFNDFYPGVDKDAHRETLEIENLQGPCWSYNDIKLLTSDFHEYTPSQGVNAAFTDAE